MKIIHIYIRIKPKLCINTEKIILGDFFFKNSMGWGGGWGVLLVGGTRKFNVPRIVCIKKHTIYNSLLTKYALLPSRAEF